MCGITGFVADRVLSEVRSTVQRMTRTLERRGPDDEGTYLGESVALGVRRLSIIDLETGHQPLSNEDGTVWAIQNGEIYNFQTLRAQLERLGHRFRTRSDSEVIIHAYEEYGEDCPAHLDGMFALAIWDVQQRTLLLARDRMGEKPLYYHAGPDVFAFGSELRALLEQPAVPRELSLESLARYLSFEYVPAPLHSGRNREAPSRPSADGEPGEQAARGSVLGSLVLRGRVAGCRPVGGRPPAAARAIRPAAARE